ncbi:MAG: hypothetical protein K9M08_14755 [Pirellula sp.]|nr:hypothetical protein [Pirellula sp.]
MCRHLWFAFFVLFEHHLDACDERIVAQGLLLAGDRDVPANVDGVCGSA